MTRQNSRPAKKSQKHRKKNPPIVIPRQTFEFEAIVVGRAKPWARIYAGEELKTLAMAECLILRPGGADTYTVVISREKPAAEAMKLQIGERLLLEGAHFHKPPKGRGVTEIHAKRFSRLP